MNDRIIEIENYWARVVRDTAEFQQIADAENPEFNTVLKCLYNILKDGFINDLTENGAMRWEKILELPVSSTATLEERKVQILTYLSIRRPYTIRVLRAMLSAIMGEGNYTLNINNDTSTLTIALASTVESMREKIDELCARVIPQNLVIKYKEGLPIDYTPVEYLKSTGSQYIDTQALNVFEYELEYAATNTTGVGVLAGYIQRGRVRAFGIMEKNKVAIAMAKGDYYREATVSAAVKNTVVYNANLGASVLINGVKYSTAAYGGKALIPSPMTADVSVYLFACNTGEKGAQGIGYSARLYSAKLKNSELTVSFDGIPVLDPTGAPCMFDLVTRTAFYNSGTGDFIYPTDAAPVMTLDLDEKFYAKRTEHGIRRLYHVPKGCTMSKDEYAAKNGFKEILEPPMPLEGYWVPEWKETETQLICEWVETEPPTEEGIEND